MKEKTFVSADESIGSAGDHHCYHIEWTPFLAQAMTPTALLTCAAQLPKCLLGLREIWQIHHRVLTVPSWETICIYLGFAERGSRSREGRDLPQITQGEKGIKHGSCIPLRAVPSPPILLKQTLALIALELVPLPFNESALQQPLGTAGSALPWCLSL